MAWRAARERALASAATPRSTGSPAETLRTGAAARLNAGARRAEPGTGAPASPLEQGRADDHGTEDRSTGSHYERSCGWETVRRCTLQKPPRPKFLESKTA